MFISHSTEKQQYSLCESYVNAAAGVCLYVTYLMFCVYTSRCPSSIWKCICQHALCLCVILCFRGFQAYTTHDELSAISTGQLFQLSLISALCIDQQKIFFSLATVFVTCCFTVAPSTSWIGSLLKI